MKFLHKNVTKINQLHNYSTVKRNPSSTNRTEWSNTLKQFAGNSRRDV